MKKNESLDKALKQINGLQKLSNGYKENDESTTMKDYTPNIVLPQNKARLDEMTNQMTSPQRLHDEYANDSSQGAPSTRPKRIMPGENNLLRNYSPTRKIADHFSPKKQLKKAIIKRYLPYLIAGGGTGVGLGWGLKAFIF